MNVIIFIEGVKLLFLMVNMVKLMEDVKKCLKCGELDEVVVYYIEVFI